ncbi:uncharacterized protein si:ch73-130a3.4 isoform X3 [Scomber scombrus]|uniref:Uncharacterized protein si:ch73-130a3.4 isoform X3 n=1 Tax=Scomber scombrus TaxID=13677 RepID=A0AAV1NEZ9_SCOSC
MSSVVAKPSLNMMMLDMLKRRQEEDPAKYGCVCLMLDSMAIRQHVQYNTHTQKMSGFVDMGDGINETDFIFLDRSGFYGWPTRPLEGSNCLLPEQVPVVLLVHALEELHERGIRVVCVTMDGHASNVRMCNQLGCQLKGNAVEPLKTHFPHPVTGERVFVLMDACHMLKLARTMLQAYSPITSTTGQINWRYIVHLNTVQAKDGLHAANKVADKHVNFDSQKMQMSLAAQTLSRSVIVALRTLRDLGYSQFQHCEATAEFIENSFSVSGKSAPTALARITWSSSSIRSGHKGTPFIRLNDAVTNGTRPTCAHSSSSSQFSLSFFCNIFAVK